MLNDRIKNLRLAHNLNQVELGDALGVSKQCVSNWENDNIQPSIEMLLKLAAYFSVSTDFLLGLDERRMLDVSALTDSQIAHIQLLIRDLSGSNIV